MSGTVLRLADFDVTIGQCVVPDRNAECAVMKSKSIGSHSNCMFCPAVVGQRATKQWAGVGEWKGGRGKTTIERERDRQTQRDITDRETERERSRDTEKTEIETEEDRDKDKDRGKGRDRQRPTDTDRKTR